MRHHQQCTNLMHFLSGGLLLSFGESVNDEVIPPGCNLYSRQIYLDPPFTYFGRDLSTVYINSDGYFSFEEIFTSCCNVHFPTISPPLIAVLWRGFDTSRFGAEGNVTYRVTRDLETLNIISSLVSRQSSDPFVPMYALVATWNMVPSDIQNDLSRYSFQGILATNGNQSFVIFSYDNLDGLGNVQVGFNLGDGYNYGPNDGPLSANNNLYSSSVDIYRSTNTGRPGIYVYRVDSKQQTLLAHVNVWIPS